MIVVDIGLFIAFGMVGFALVVLWKDVRMLKGAKKHIEQMAKLLHEREDLIMRLTHELERHGCDDELLINEARGVCMPINLPNEFKES